ncbi:hypothetical protein D018_0867B, partial [Vibrio parahaemolyticus VP2007-007]
AAIEIAVLLSSGQWHQSYKLRIFVHSA